MNETNVLILSAGRRVELVQCFQRASIKLGIESKIVAGDCSATAPALYFSDKKVLLPQISESQYIDNVIFVCRMENIKLLVPTIDTDLILLSDNKVRIESESCAKVLVSSPEVVSICRDKRNTQKFLLNNNFLVPKLYSEEGLEADELSFPLFIKPNSGSSSINSFKVNNRNELSFYRSLINDSIVQDYLEGEEYTVDAFLDFNGKLITAVPRLRIATRGGEVSKGKIVKDYEIIDSVKRLVSILRPIGQITIQLKKTIRGVEYIEINPRFGGGAPMSIMCGADSCENLYRLLNGESLNYNEDYLSDITILRFDNSICLNKNMEIMQ